MSPTHLPGPLPDGCGAPAGGVSVSAATGSQAVVEGHVTREGTPVSTGYARLLGTGDEFVAEVPLGDDGGFRFFAAPGSWTLRGTTLPLVGRARVYACGITPYDVTHVGHAAAFVWVDTLARVLREAGAEVIICRNVTDVDDVLLAAADRAGSPYDRFAAIQQFYFDQDMAALGVGQPALQPRAHAYIGQVIALAAGLLDRGAADERGGQVWFRGAAAARAAVPDRDLALRLAAEYGDDPADPAKDDPFDVAVWRASKSGEPGWASPWGTGRPGWHAECAAMALHAFGPAVDAQAGGGDLPFPHHAY